MGCKDGAASVAARTWAVLLAQFPYFQSGTFKQRRRLLQRLLQLVRVRLPAVRQRRQNARLTKGVVGQFLELCGILPETHLPPSFLFVRRSVGEVVMASYSFWVAWNWTGTWL